MPSEGRLHPLSFLFQIGGQLQQLLVPAILLLVGTRSAGMQWEFWVASVIVPSAIAAVLKTLSFRYRFEATDLVMTSGFIFRNERHVPYARIQNIDARQTVFHRLLDVVEVRVETGGGDEPEASLRVLPASALAEMRERVFAGRRATSVTADGVDHAAPAPAETLLRLRTRDLLIAGFVDSRGLVIVSAAFGLLWETGVFDRAFGDDFSGRGLVRQVVGAVFGGGAPSPGRIALMLGAFVAVLLAMRVLSMGWSVLRLHGFKLLLAGDDLRAEFGLFTRVMTTIPVRRIQTLTVREGPFHRLFGMASVRVDSAGGDARTQGVAKREHLAPIVERRALPELLHRILPDVDVGTVAWQRVDPRGVRRGFKARLVFYALMTVPTIGLLGRWSLLLFAALAVLAYVDARLQIKHMGWAMGEHAVVFRSGWVVRQLTVARFSKIQVVALGESPFDRRYRMASVYVDTAGAVDLSHRVAIPYLTSDTAQSLHAQLVEEAERTAFRW
jgi:putative membrane protein